MNGPEDLTAGWRLASQDEYIALDHTFGNLGAILGDLRMTVNARYRGTMHADYLFDAIDMMRDDADQMLRWFRDRHVEGRLPSATCSAGTVLIRSHVNRLRELTKVTPFP